MRISPDFSKVYARWTDLPPSSIIPCIDSVKYEHIVLANKQKATPSGTDTPQPDHKPKVMVKVLLPCGLEDSVLEQLVAPDEGMIGVPPPSHLSTLLKFVVYR